MVTKIIAINFFNYFLEHARQTMYTRVKYYLILNTVMMCEISYGTV